MHKTEHKQWKARGNETERQPGEYYSGREREKVMQKEERHYMRGIKTDKRQ